MDLEFMRNQDVKLQALDVLAKPNFTLIRNNFFLEEDRKFMAQMIVCLVVVLILMLIK